MVHDIFSYYWYVYTDFSFLQMEELDKEVKKLREDLQTLQKEKEKSDSGKLYSARSHTGTCIAFTSHSGI